MDKPLLMKMTNRNNLLVLQAIPPKGFWQRLAEWLRPFWWFGIGFMIGWLLGS